MEREKFRGYIIIVNFAVVTVYSEYLGQSMEEPGTQAREIETWARSKRRKCARTGCIVYLRRMKGKIKQEERKAGVGIYHVEDACADYR